MGDEDDEYPGPSEPFTAEDLEYLRIKIYPSMPTFRAEDWSIASSDVSDMCWRWKWVRTPAQLRSYLAYWDKNFEGRAPFSVMHGILQNAHLAGPWLREYVTACDKNKDGFIQQEEFELFIDIFRLHFPGLKKSYSDFVAEADTNRDGKVSIDEAVAWHEKQANLPQNRY